MDKDWLDCLALTNGGFVIIDYKTNTIMPRL